MDITINPSEGDEHVAHKLLYALFEDKRSNFSRYRGIRLTTKGGEVFDVKGGMATVLGGRYVIYFERKTPVQANGYIADETVVQKYQIPYTDIETIEVNP